MSRGIKFRAWDKEDKKLWKVVSITESIWGDCEESHIRVCEFHENPSKKETDVRMSVDYELMQYTGLKDKNGKEIFEGDILAINNTRYVVGYRAYSGGWQLEIKNEYCAEMVQGNCELLEIIGNVYEHKHLLEETA